MRMSLYLDGRLGANGAVHIRIAAMLTLENLIERCENFELGLSSTTARRTTPCVMIDLSAYIRSANAHIAGNDRSPTHE